MARFSDPEDGTSALVRSIARIALSSRTEETQQEQLTLAQPEDQFRQMPHFPVEQALPTRTQGPKVTSSIKNPKEIPDHQRVRLIVRERGLGPDVVLISDFNYIQHGTRDSSGQPIERVENRHRSPFCRQPEVFRRGRGIHEPSVRLRIALQNSPGMPGG
jgi:hypothetical protein